MLSRILRRPFSTTPKRRSLLIDPELSENLKKTAEEEHFIGALEPLIKLCFWVGIPVASGYLWYHEYHEHMVHPERVKHIKYPFMKIRFRNFPWKDGNHSLMHHPYWNALPDGYETDKEGNYLPPGVYVDE